jgi:hypothetical protein
VRTICRALRALRGCGSDLVSRVGKLLQSICRTLILRECATGGTRSTSARFSMLQVSTIYGFSISMTSGRSMACISIRAWSRSQGRYYGLYVGGLTPILVTLQASTFKRPDNLVSMRLRDRALQFKVCKLTLDICSILDSLIYRNTSHDYSERPWL